MTLQLLRDGILPLTGLVAVGALGFLFARSASAAAWALVAIAVPTTAIVPAVELRVTATGMNLYALDLVTGLMLAIGFTRLFTQRTPSVLAFPLAALSIAFVIHAAWGMAEFGLQAAVNNLRDWLYLLGPLVFGSTAVPRWTRDSFLPLLVGASALAGVALIQIANHGLYGADQFISIGGQMVDARPVTAVGALLIVQCLVISLSAGFARSAVWWPAIASMVAAAVLLQHRTVWIVGFVIAALGYVKWARAAIFTNERAALGAASALLFLTPVAVTLLASSTAFAESAHSATGQNSTLEWRTEGWKSLLEKHDSIQDFLVGIPAGTSLERQINHQIVIQSPHSLYVDSLLTLGTLGPLTFAWLWILIIRRRRNVAIALSVPGAAVVLIVVSDAVFGITNLLGSLQGLLLGMLLQATYRSPRPDRGRTASARLGLRGNPAG